MNDRFKFRYVLDKEVCEVLAFDVSDGIEHKCLFLQLKDGTRKIINDYDWSKFMQCTGLKDKNGKLIYEGDIVKINENYCDYSAIEDFYINQNFVVEYFQPRAVYLLKPFEYKDNDGSGIYDLSPDFYEFLKWKPCGKLEEYTLQGIELIGNIYENEDLLKCENQ